MGSKTKTVGGGNATGTANAFNDFLYGQLNPTGKDNSAEISQLTTIMNSGPPGINKGAIQQRINELTRQQSGSGGQPSMFQDLMKQFSSGNVPDISGSGQGIQNLISGGVNGFQQPTYGNTYNAPEYQGASLDKLFTGFGGTGLADLSSVNGIPNRGQINTATGIGSVPTSGLDGLFKQYMSTVSANGAGGVGALETKLDPATVFDMNNPYFKAIKDSSTMASDRNAGELRARFGAQGAGSMGTGAQYAESNLRATEAPALTIAMQQALQGLQQQDLAERSTGANIALGSAGQNLQGQIANQNAGIQNSSNILQSLLTGRGQDLDAAGQARGQDINQMGLGVQQLLGLRGQDIDLRGQDIDSILRNQTIGNTFTQNNNDLNSRNTQTNNQNSIMTSQNRNDFNTTNANNTANYGLGANQLNSNNASNAMSQFMQALGMGQQGNQFSAGQQGDILRMLFSGFQQANGLGTPGAQTVEQPNPWAQLGGLIVNGAGNYYAKR